MVDQTPILMDLVTVGILRDQLKKDLEEVERIKDRIKGGEEGLSEELRRAAKKVAETRGKICQSETLTMDYDANEGILYDHLQTSRPLIMAVFGLVLALGEEGVGRLRDREKATVTEFVQCLLSNPHVGTDDPRGLVEAVRKEAKRYPDDVLPIRFWERHKEDAVDLLVRTADYPGSPAIKWSVPWLTNAVRDDCDSVETLLEELEKSLRDDHRALVVAAEIVQARNRKRARAKGA